MKVDIIQAWAETEKAQYGGGDFWDGIIDMCTDWRAMHDYLRWHTSEGNGQLHPLASGILANLKVKS